MKTLRMPAAALAATLSLWACDDAVTAPESARQAVNDDVAVLVADAIQEDLEVMTATIPGGALASGPVAMNVLNYTRSRTVQFFDADGVEQDAYDALATASIHTVLEVAGERSRSDFEWSMDRTRDMWVTGLEGEETERTWNGTGTDDRSRARMNDEGETRTYDLTGTLLVEDVVRGVPRDQHPWPLSGTITRDLTIEITNGPNGDETITRTVVITFDGTQYPEMTVDGELYEVDLAAHGRHRARRGKHHGG